MKKTFSFALGNLWQWAESKNRSELLKYAKKLNISGIEITLAWAEELYAFKTSKNNKKWLNSLDYVSIHAPFDLLNGKDDQNEIMKRLDALMKVYKEVSATNVIIHPDNLPSPKILEKYDFNVSTENLTPKSKIGINYLRKVFKEYPKIKLCLDVSHAYLWSEIETKKIINNFEKRISQIHLSGTYRKQDHRSLRIVTKKFMKSIEPIKKLRVPIVIEEDIENDKSEKYLREEVDYIKTIFQ